MARKKKTEIEVVVLKNFIDKYTKELYKKDKELKITNERYDEIMKTNKELIRKIGK